MENEKEESWRRNLSLQVNLLGCFSATILQPCLTTSSQLFYWKAWHVNEKREMSADRECGNSDSTSQALLAGVSGAVQTASLQTAEVKIGSATEKAITAVATRTKFPTYREESDSSRRSR